jgi:hypothetical protein
MSTIILTLSDIFSPKKIIIQRGMKTDTPLKPIDKKLHCNICSFNLNKTISKEKIIAIKDVNLIKLNPDFIFNTLILVIKSLYIFVVKPNIKPEPVPNIIIKIKAKNIPEINGLKYVLIKKGSAIEVSEANSG